MCTTSIKWCVLLSAQCKKPYMYRKRINLLEVYTCEKKNKTKKKKTLRLQAKKRRSTALKQRKQRNKTSGKGNYI